MVLFAKKDVPLTWIWARLLLLVILGHDLCFLVSTLLATDQNHNPSALKNIANLLLNINFTWYSKYIICLLHHDSNDPRRCIPSFS